MDAAALGEILGRIVDRYIVERIGVLDMDVAADKHWPVERRLEPRQFSRAALDYPLISDIGADDDIAANEIGAGNMSDRQSGLPGVAQHIDADFHRRRTLDLAASDRPRGDGRRRTG